jgi:hypothetical protein
MRQGYHSPSTSEFSPLPIWRDWEGENKVGIINYNISSIFNIKNFNKINNKK